MIKNETNPTTVNVEAVRAHVALRVDLLASCARAANGLNNAASRFAYCELRAIEDGLTDIEAVQAAVCAKFPKLTGNGKPSKTPNSSFRTSWDKIVLLHDVLNGLSKTYDRPEALAIAQSFVATDNAVRDDTGKIVSLRLTLNDVVDRIKDDKAAAGRERARNKTDEEKAAEKAAEEAATVAAYVNAVAESPAMLAALAERIAAYTVEDAGKADAIAKLYDAIGAFTATLQAAEEAERKAA